MVTMNFQIIAKYYLIHTAGIAAAMLQVKLRNVKVKNNSSSAMSAHCPALIKY